MRSVGPELIQARVGARVVVRDGTLLDGSRADVEIVDGRIRAIGTVAEASTDCSVDATGCWIAPGLVDAHAHAVSPLDDGALDTAGSVAFGRGLIRSALAMRDRLDHGVTTLGSACGSISAAAALRVARTEGIAAGPRLVLTAGVLADRGVRVAARRSFGFGADVLAIGACGARDQGLTAEQLASVVDEAHTRGALVCCVSDQGDTQRAAVLAGVDTIVGIPSGGNQLIELLVANKVRLVPLLAARDPRAGQAFLRTALEAGLEIAAGSAGGDLGAELAALRAAGCSADQVLRAAGPSAAAALGRHDEIGVIAPGFCADLILAQADPRVDVTMLARADRIRAVIVGVD